MPSELKALLFSPNAHDHASLHNVLGNSPWKLEAVFSARDGLRHLRKHPVTVVLCEKDLPDGDWKSVMHQLNGLPEKPIFIVCTRLADDRLWAEALNLGAFDVLSSAPFDSREVVRVMEGAWHTWTRSASQSPTRTAAG